PARVRQEHHGRLHELGADGAGPRRVGRGSAGAAPPGVVAADPLSLGLRRVLARPTQLRTTSVPAERDRTRRHARQAGSPEPADWPVREEDPVREFDTTFIVQPEISEEGREALI